MPGRPARRIVICGGGVAAVEGLLALRELIEIAQIDVVAPNPTFVYQPLAVAEPFNLAETHMLELAEIADDMCATLHRDSLVRVEGEHRRAVLENGAALPYDALLIAVGAEPRAWLPGALHFAGAESVEAFKQLLERAADGRTERVCFVSPAGASWTLPLYELALLTAAHLAERGVIGVELSVVTPEADPLAVFGPAASHMLRGLLGDRGITLKAGAYADSFEHGALRLRLGTTLEVDEVVALARLHGPAVPGVSSDASGFAIVDDHGRVAGMGGVYAAGDGTTFPIKQGGIAAQQADAAAEMIAAALGAAVEPAPFRPTLRGMLLTGIAPTFMRAQIAPPGGGWAAAANPLWWPPSKIAGRYLAPYLAGRDALAVSRTLEDRQPLAHDPRTVEPAHQEARELALAFADRDAAERHFKSALEWLAVIERLDGVLPRGYLRKRADWQERVRG